MKIKVLLRAAMVLMMLWAAAGQPVSAQVCDGKLDPDDNRAIQYRARKNRCEGFYGRKVSATGGLAVVGLTDGAFRFELNPKELLTVSSPVLTDQTVFVRAVGVALKTYYRMDAQLTPGKTLAWPVKDILEPMRLSHEAIGVFGWIGTDENPVYVPVKATPQMATVAQDGIIRLAIRASVDASNVQWRAGVVQNGAIGELGDWHSMSRKSYREGEPIIIALPNSATGELYVEVSAQDQHSASSLNSLSVYVMVRR